MRPLDTLRAFARRTDSETPALFSQSSLISQPETLSTQTEAIPQNSERSEKTNEIGGLGKSTDCEKSELSEKTTLAHHDPEERAAIIEHDGVAPRTWAEGHAALCSMAPPTGVSPARWQRIIDATGRFLDRWAAEAIRCGWSDLDVFGCHPQAPDRRFDYMGLALLLDRVEVVALDEHGVDLLTRTGARQRFRRRPMPDGTVSLWTLR